MTKLTLVLLPGMDGTGALFEPFIDALQGEFNISIVMYPVNETLGYAQLEGIAQTFLPKNEAFVILGESFSGPIAVSIAASGSENLKALILCCSFVKNPRPILSPVRGLIDFLPVALAPISALSHLLLGRFSTAALRAKLAESLKKVSSSTLRMRLKAVLDVDASQKITAIKVPVQYLRASQDVLVPSSASALIANLRPTTHIVELEAPHFLLQAAPAEAAKAISEFVRGVACAQTHQTATV